MKAKFINELQNFERSGTPLNRLDIGVGGQKYIKDFEKILDLIAIEWEKNTTEDKIIYNLYWQDKKDNRQNFWISVERKGWKYPGQTNAFDEHPFSLLPILINEFWGNLPDKIEELDDELKMFKRINAGVLKANEIIKKYK